MKIFSLEKLNTGRQIEFDLAKAICIFFMVYAHIVDVWFSHTWGDMIYCKVTTASTIFGIFNCMVIFAFTFMFAMGACVCYSRHQSPHDLALRGWKLIAIWFLVHLAHSYCMALLYAAEEGMSFAWYMCTYVIMSDILFFAGLFLIYLALLKKANFTTLGIVLCSCLVFCLGHFVSYDGDNYLLNLILGNFLISKITFMPFLNWIIIPTLGYCFGKLLLHCQNKNRLYGSIGLFCTLACITLWRFVSTNTLIEHIRFEEITSGAFFHRVNIVSICVSVIVFGVFLSLCYFIMKTIKWSPFRTVVSYLADKLNKIYIVHWIIIPFVAILMQRPPKPATPLKITFLSAIVLAASCACVAIYEKLLAKHKA